jgi:hypothetical protein
VQRDVSKMEREKLGRGVRCRDPCERTGRCGGNGSTSVSRESARGIPSPRLSPRLVHVRPVRDRETLFRRVASRSSVARVRTRPAPGDGGILQLRAWQSDRPRIGSAVDRDRRTTALYTNLPDERTLPVAPPPVRRRWRRRRAARVGALVLPLRLDRLARSAALAASARR